jgi:hypothetical protein
LTYIFKLSNFLAFSKHSKEFLMLAKVGQSVLSAISSQIYSPSTNATVGFTFAITALSVVGAAIYYAKNRKIKAKKEEDTSWGTIALQTIGVTAALGALAKWGPKNGPLTPEQEKWAEFASNMAD